MTLTYTNGQSDISLFLNCIIYALLYQMLYIILLLQMNVIVAKVLFFPDYVSGMKHLGWL